MLAASLRMRRWRKNNRLRDRENGRRWRKNNLKKARAKTRAWYAKNREYQLSKNATWYKKNKEHVNRRVRNRRHGITQEQYDKKIQEQDNRCAVCHKVFDRTPHVDHNHACCPKLRSCDKCRRGLLCSACNVMIGMAKDSKEILSNAIEYLRGYSQCQL
jgi:Recombination endonuclease VII